MDETPPDRPRQVPDLKAALRAARAEDAQRTEVIGDLRSIALARLALLRDAIEPVLAQIPGDIDLFDVGVMPGDPPRLFIDMIAFVEMARDKRGYRFIQDRREGRVVLAEHETIESMVDAITRYIARRLVERDRALASEPIHPIDTLPPSDDRWVPDALEQPYSRVVWHRLGQALWFIVKVAGLLALIGLAVFGLHWLHVRHFG